MLRTLELRLVLAYRALIRHVILPAARLRHALKRLYIHAAWQVFFLLLWLRRRR